MDRLGRFNSALLQSGSSINYIELKILANILADHLQTILPILICSELSYAVKGRTIQDSLHMVHTIAEKVAGKAALINLDQSKTFDRVDYRFLEAVLPAAGFGFHFRRWIRFLYASPGVMVEVNGVRSRPFTLTPSIRQGFPLSPVLYVLTLEPLLRKLKAYSVLRGLTLPGSTEVDWYTAYAGDISVLVTNSAKKSEGTKL